MVKQLVLACNSGNMYKAASVAGKISGFDFLLDEQLDSAIQVSIEGEEDVSG